MPLPGLGQGFLPHRCSEVRRETGGEIQVTVVGLVISSSPMKGLPIPLEDQHPKHRHNRHLQGWMLLRCQTLPYLHILGDEQLVGRVRLSMVLPRTNTPAAGPQAIPGEGKCQISVNVKVRSVMQAWAGCLSHLVDLPGLSVSGDPKAFLMVFFGIFYIYIFIYTYNIYWYILSCIPH